jgi:hypothetical protein
MNKLITMKYEDGVFDFSDGYWMPVEYLVPTCEHNMNELKRLYLKSWFTESMFKKVLEVIKGFDYDIDEILIASGRWQVMKNYANGVRDFELELYQKNMLEHG